MISTMHQVLYKGMNAFQGLMPAFLNIPYKPIWMAITTKMNNNQLIPMRMILWPKVNIGVVIYLKLSQTCQVLTINSLRGHWE
jgi:hypothetical protein